MQSMDLRTNWIYILISGFGIGVLWRSLLNFGVAFSAFVALLAFIAVLLYALRRDAHVFIVAFFLVGASIGVIRFDIADLKQGSALLDSLEGQRVTVAGIIVDEPDVRETNTKLTVRLSEANGVKVNTKALFTTDIYTEYSYGDHIRVSGTLDKPKGFVGDDGRYFDYKSFLGKDDIFYQIFFPEVELLEGHGGNPVRRALFDIKNTFLERTAQVVPEPQNSLLGGLVVGAKQSLGEQLLDDFRKTGIIHIVVLSGYNVTIVAEFIMRFFAFLPAAAGMSLGAGAIVAFAAMTGASATIVRASIMALLVILARATGRTYAMTRALFIAGFIMVLHNPKILVFDTSFQLSFVATLGLIYLAPKLEHYCGWVPTKLQLREFATATIATQLFVLPILLYKMGEVSLVALPVNLLILAVVPITMLLGFFTGLLGFLGIALSIPFALVTNLLLSYQLWIVDLFSKIPFASIHIDTFPMWVALLIYMLYALVLWRLREKSH